jgi:hypothetical protein
MDANSPLAKFDPRKIAYYEKENYVAYYQKRWLRLLRVSVSVVKEIYTFPGYTQSTPHTWSPAPRSPSPLFLTMMYQKREPTYGAFSLSSTRFTIYKSILTGPPRSK